MKYIKTQLVNGIKILTICRAEALNALNAEVLDELQSAILELEADQGGKCFLITGEGKAFVAGADIGAMSRFDSTQALEFSRKGQELFLLIERSRLVSIAAINGFALGGGLELALSCDIRYASRNAKIGLPEVSLGLIPGFGGTQRLARLCGRGVAFEYIFSGNMYSAEEALVHGVITKVTEQESLIEECLKLAQAISSRGKFALQAAKTTIQQGLEMDTLSGMNLEREKFSSLFSREESKEGMRAFLEKRKPDF